MKALLFADLHGNLDAIQNIAKLLETADVGFCLGDLASFHKGLEQATNRLDVGTELYLLPGNHEVAHEVNQICQEKSNFHFFHEKSVSLGVYTFAGIGGGVESTWGMPFELSAEAATQILNQYRDLVNLILLTHTPPFGTKVDIAFFGRHIGAHSIRQFIEEVQPIAVYSGHVHEAEGAVDNLGNTLLRSIGKKGYFLNI
jgi:Icc-related predicted phosphoesterase